MGIGVLPETEIGRPGEEDGETRETVGGCASLGSINKHSL